MAIHLVNPMWDDGGGSEHRVAALFEILRPHASVTIWSEQAATRRWQARVPIRRIVPWRLAFPRGGTLVVVGVYFPLGGWTRWTRAARTILVCNTLQKEDLARQRRQLCRDGRRPLELVFPSEPFRLRVGLPGRVEPSFIDLTEFTPRSTKNSAFTVGRLSRDVARKHHEADAALYRRLASRGCRVRVMGGTVLAAAFPDGQPPEGITLLPAQFEPASQFLAGLDCFYYRTSEALFEPSGRVVTEAMAMGLPVVAHRSGGYAEWIDSGENGFLFDTGEEAAEIIERLRLDPERRRRVGAEARRTVERLFSAEARSEVVAFFTKASGA